MRPSIHTVLHGQDCSCSFFVDGTFYTITAEGGKGGKSGNSGGAGGQGGSVSVPAALLSDSRFAVQISK